jgi:hypothetical protein
MFRVWPKCSPRFSIQTTNLSLGLSLLPVSPFSHVTVSFSKLLANIMSLKAFAISLFSFALFFWCWALKNTIHMQPPMFDYGIVSFGSVLLTTSYVWALANADKKPESRLTRSLAISSHVLVALNYLLGAYIGFTVLDRPGFGWYCIIFTALWLGIASSAARLLDNDDNNGSGSGRSENQGLVS